ncbi:MAG: hypothetical protein ACTSO4_06555, partial [Promethearchaeota archaeon]
IIELTREVQKYGEKLEDLKNELEEKFLKKERFVQSYENRVAAMKLLINKKYISSAIFQFIRALQVGRALSVKNIIQAIDMREDQARKIINKLIEENAPIDYDPSSGTITLKEEVDF